MGKTLHQATIEAFDKLATTAKLPTYTALAAALEHAVEAASDTAQEEGCEECNEAKRMLKKIRRHAGDEQ